ncbi:MAG TPA: imidazolonepropionase, partial [Tepidisphaeraceae bacterium]|nr:imidazolonepropionase [Tepidisphaeraceae bacterium]
MAATISNPTSSTRIWRNARIATCDPTQSGLGIIEHGAIVCRDGRIIYCGNDADLPSEFLDSSEVIDCERRWITPGLIDCHTHLVHAGNRANEFEMRLEGATYEEIARAGGGIASSVRALRGADESRLIEESLPRLDALIAEGVTSVEIKSGYGLDLENERKALRAARGLGELRAIDVTTTFLGAHALPPEANGDKDAYIEEVVEEMMPALAEEQLMDAVDAFCEGIAFSAAQVEIVFNKARSLRLPVKLHADQLSNLHGAELAARFDALSADHLEYTDEDGVRA